VGFDTLKNRELVGGHGVGGRFRWVSKETDGWMGRDMSTTWSECGVGGMVGAGVMVGQPE